MRERFKGLEPVENKELEKELWSKKRDLTLEVEEFEEVWNHRTVERASCCCCSRGE